MWTDRRSSPDRRLLRDRRAVDEQTLQLLCDVYHKLWSTAYYNPTNRNSVLEEFAQPLAEKMRQANEVLRFKR